LGVSGKKLQEAEENCLVTRIQILYASPISITVIDTKGAIGDACRTHGSEERWNAETRNL